MSVGWGHGMGWVRPRGRFEGGFAGMGAGMRTLVKGAYDAMRKVRVLG